MRELEIEGRMRKYICQGGSLPLLSISLNSSLSSRNASCHPKYPKRVWQLVLSGDRAHIPSDAVMVLDDFWEDARRFGLVALCEGQWLVASRAMADQGARSMLQIVRRWALMY